MTDVTTLLAGIKTRALDCSTYKFGMRNADKLAHDDVPRLVAAIEAVEDLAKYLDTLAEGDQHYAALFRAAVVAALGGGE